MSNLTQPPIMDHFRFLFCSPQLLSKEKCINCVCFLGLAQSFCGQAVKKGSVIRVPQFGTMVSCCEEKWKNRMMYFTVVVEQG